jgi:hypothetical protein
VYQRLRQKSRPEAGTSSFWHQTDGVLDPTDLRATTRARLVELHFPNPPSLLPARFDPAEGYALRPVTDLVTRLSVLTVAIAASFGMPPELTTQWVADNDLEKALSPREAAAISGDERALGPDMQAQVEAIWAIMWMLSLGERLDPCALCPQDLVRSVPDLPEGESVAAWQARTAPSLRPADNVMSELDLHYAMTWGLADANRRGVTPPGDIGQYAIWQRRRALEFALTRPRWAHAQWDGIDLST